MADREETPEGGKGPDLDLSPEEMEDAEAAWDEIGEEDSPSQERKLPTPPRLEGEGLQPSTREGEEKPLTPQEIKQGAEEFLQMIAQMLEQEMGGGQDQQEQPSPQQGKSLNSNKTVGQMTAKEMAEAMQSVSLPEHLIPEHLYLGMPAEHASGVQNEGLTPGKKGRLAHVGGNRSDSIYMVVNAERAGNYTNAYEHGTVAKIDTSKLDKSRFYYDHLDLGEHDPVTDPQQMAYRGHIPPEAIVGVSHRHNAPPQ